MFQPRCFPGGQDSPSFGWSRFGTWGRVYSWDFLLMPLVLLQLVQNSKIWAYQNKSSVFKDASYKNSRYIQSDLISTINYSWAKWESRSQKYEKCPRPRDFQAIQYKMKVHRLNIFSLKCKVLNQEIPQNQDFLCVCVWVCVRARACMCMCGAREGVQTRSGDTGPTFLKWRQPSCAACSGQPASPHWPHFMFLTHSVCH